MQPRKSFESASCSLSLKVTSLYMHFVNQQVVQETNQQILAEFLSEEAFESPIGEGVNIFTHGKILR